MGLMDGGITVTVRTAVFMIFASFLPVTAVVPFLSFPASSFQLVNGLSRCV